MTIQELHFKLAEAKKFLQSEIIKIKTEKVDSLSLLEVSQKLDRIHEAERVGIRNLDETDFQRISKVITSIEALRNLPKN